MEGDGAEPKLDGTERHGGLWATSAPMPALPPHCEWDIERSHACTRCTLMNWWYNFAV